MSSYSVLSKVTIIIKESIGYANGKLETHSVENNIESGSAVHFPATTSDTINISFKCDTVEFTELCDDK